jgi:zinc transporter 9
VTGFKWAHFGRSSFQPSRLLLDTIELVLGLLSDSFPVTVFPNLNLFQSNNHQAIPIYQRPDLFRRRLHLNLAKSLTIIASSPAQASSLSLVSRRNVSVTTGLQKFHSVCLVVNVKSQDVGRLVFTACSQPPDGYSVRSSPKSYFTPVTDYWNSSFIAGALPLSMTLSSSQLRMISTIGMGVLVGTSLIVIIPEGIEAVYTAGSAGHMHTRKDIRLSRRSWPVNSGIAPLLLSGDRSIGESKTLVPRELPIALRDTTTSVAAPIPPPDAEATPPAETPHDKNKLDGHHDKAEDRDPPTFAIGVALISGFVLMFLIDKLPRHASENLQAPPPPRHIALDNLSMRRDSSPSGDDEESESFLRSMAPTPKQTRSLATTTGLVIHATADGIAMGASTSTSNQELGIIIFIAIMIHKMPAAFGLTSVLLKQGLSKRAARGHLIIFSLAAPFGALSTWLLVSILGGSHIEGERGQFWTGMLLLFSGGTFL